MARLEELTFDNTYARLPDAFFSRLSPAPFPGAHLVAFSPDAARLLDLDPGEAERPELVEYFSGERLLPGSEPLAMLYAGHQFGTWVPQLGDGRALLLCEVVNRTGQRWDLHLKGSGKTPYSRFGDGRAVLRSTIREFLCSEAMHALGIATTRALCIVGGSEPVYRERVERNATLLRLSPSHVRFGTFEVFADRGQLEHVRTLLDYVVRLHFPSIPEGPDRAARFLEEVAVRTARLVASWQAAGFAHGVMNTDNMSIVGATLDYGPFGFLDDFALGYVPNHSDHTGLYAFGRQPAVALWNLARLAEALLPLAGEEAAVTALGRFEPEFSARFLDLMRAKLGLVEARDGDGALVSSLLELLQESRPDYALFFRGLAELPVDGEGCGPLPFDPAAARPWVTAYRERLRAEGSDDPRRRVRMNRVNPLYVLRNYVAEGAIRSAVDDGDYGEIARVLELLRDPFTPRPGGDAFEGPPPAWGRGLVISCSS